MPNTGFTSDASSADLIRAKPFGAALHPRLLGRADSLPGQTWAALLVQEGAVSLRAGEREWEVAAPAICWLPWSEACRLTIGPGADGCFVNLSATPLYNAIGYKAESAELRILTARQITLPLTGREALRAFAEDCFAAIVAEQNHQAAAVQTVVEAYLRLFLVHLWRALDEARSVRNPRSPRLGLYDRFTALVETHFRERWTVARYAEALGISRDRLGDICRSASGRSPKNAIDLRTTIEARLLLEHSTNSVEQIAGLLGFASPGHFSRSFQRIVGVPPGQFRSRQMWKQPEGDQKAALHEWP